VNVVPIVKMLDVSPVATQAASLAQVSDRSPQTFNESLLAASKASSSMGAANQGGTGTGCRHKPVSQDSKLLPSVRAFQSAAPPQKIVQERVRVAPQPSSVHPAVIPMQLPLGEPGRSASASTVAGGQPMRDVLAAKFLPMESKPAQQVLTKSDSVPSSHAPKENDSKQAASVLPEVPHVLQTTTNPSNALGNEVLNTVSSTLPTPPNTNASVFANALPGVPPDAVHTQVPSAVSNPVPSPATNVASSVIEERLPDAIPSTAPTAVPGALPTAVRNQASPVLLNTISDASSDAAPAPVLHDAANPSAKGDAAPKSSSVPTSQTNPPAARPDPIPDASSNTAPGPVLHDAVHPSAKGDVAPKLSSVSTSQTNPPVVIPDPSGLATGLSVPGATADQLVALIQPGGGLLVAAQASPSSVSPAAVAKPSVIAVADDKDGANNAINDVTGSKQHAQAAPELTASPTGSQGTAQSGDQSQSDASQGQSADPAQVNFANHIIAAVDHGQNAGVAAPSQTAPTPSGVTGHTAKTADIAAPATVALPQAVPVINTAKLIQTMGQSEMRVGMRSNDFGNISISTSATRDLISAQISLDHGELARTLAAHLPEMQARLGGNQAMDVRIDMNGQAMGQGAGNSPGMSNGSPDQSRGDRQQKGGATSSQSTDGFAGRGSSIAAAGLPSGDGRIDARLDIRV
jgi:hypothetical protein